MKPGWAAKTLIDCLILFPRSLWCCAFYFELLFPSLFFRLKNFYWPVFKSLTLSSVISILLLSPSSEIFISDIEFFSFRISIVFALWFVVLCWDFLFFHYNHIFLYLIEHNCNRCFKGFDISNIWVMWELDFLRLSFPQFFECQDNLDCILGVVNVVDSGIWLLPYFSQEWWRCV